MKKKKFYALIGTIVLTGAIALTSCSESEEVVNNPNYNPETGEVTANFVFNVSTSNTPTAASSPSSTRMSAYDTQANVKYADDFRGITNSELLSFTLGNDGKNVASAATAQKKFSFGTIIGAKKLDPTYGDKSTEVTKSHRIVELSLPTGTNTLMFYGKAVKTGGDNEQGKIVWNVSDNLANTSFSMCKIVPEEADPSSPLIYEAAFKQYENLMANVLTQIIRSNVKKGTKITFNNHGTEEAVTLDADLNWSDFVNVSADKKLSEKKTAPLDPAGTTPMCALGEILSKAFVTLNSIYANELRSGSGAAVSFMMKDLMVVVNSVVNASPVSLQEVVAQEVGKDIKKNIETFFDSDDEYRWKITSVVKENMTAVLSENKDKVNDGSDLNIFPKNFNLPLGAVVLQFIIEPKSDSSGYDFTYAYKGTVETYAMGGSTTTMDAFDPMNYMYPAELCYFGNSPLRITDATKVSNDYPDGASEWDASDSWSPDWTAGSHVLSSTRSVAMQYNVNYGTALLATTVRYGSNELQDHNAYIQSLRSGATEENNVIDVSANDTHFQLTGILVGGQEPEVGWDYIAKSETAGFGAMVYDNVGAVNIPKATSAAGGEKSTISYTLLWDNWQESLLNQKQREVYVALEFKNNSVGFWGENNFIRNGGSFYLVGKLNPDKPGTEDLSSDRSAGITWPSNQALPPYDADGNTIKQRRVFIQDFMTTADFVIGPTSLQHALVAVPDLRSGQISLGLSVDLQWQTGLTFNNVILGDQ